MQIILHADQDRTSKANRMTAWNEIVNGSLQEDLQLLILQNTGGWTLEGDASEQLEALYRQQSEDKLNDAMADVLALCRERWQGLKRTTRRDVVQHCDGFKDKDRRALRYLRSLEDKGLLESKADTTENGTEITFKPTE